MPKISEFTVRITCEFFKMTILKGNLNFEGECFIAFIAFIAFSLMCYRVGYYYGRRTKVIQQTGGKEFM